MFPRPRPGGENGFTLIEALVAMIVGIVVLAGAAAGIGKLFRSSEISTEASNIVQIATNLKNVAGSGGAFGELTNELATKYKVFPENMAHGPKGALNSWNGEVNVGIAPDKQIFIDYNGVPAEGCQQLVMKLWPAGSWLRIQINDAAGIPKNISLTEIADSCNNKDDKNKITFVL